MRETWARRIAMLTGGLVVVLAMVFAYHQNPPRRAPVAVPPPVVVQPAAPPSLVEKPTTPEVPLSLIEAGEEVYAEQACARCHSIAGRGGARGSLDGVGARLGDAEIRLWVTPSSEAKGFQARHANIELTPAQRDALVAYLRSLH